MSSAAVVNSVSKPFWIAVSDGHRQMSLAAAGLAMQARIDVTITYVLVNAL
jgi:hypothetical protein